MVVLLGSVCVGGFHRRPVAPCPSCATAAGRADSAAAEHFRKGLEFAKQGQFAQAETEYREAVRIDPRNADYRAALGDALAAQGKSSEADGQYQQEQKLKQSQPKPAPRTTPKKSGSGKTGSTASARKKPTSGKTTAATTELHPPRTRGSSPPIARTDPLRPGPGDGGNGTDPSFGSASGTVTTQRNGNPITITRPGGRTITVRPGGVVTVSPTAGGAYEEAIGLMDRGDDLAAKGRFAEAERLYRQALTLSPKIADGWQSLGKACLVQKKWQEAVKAFRQAVKLTDEAEFHADLAEALLRAGQRDEAVTEARTAIARGLQDRPFYKELGLP